ncbi:uncharacterized protein LOC142548180 [Primulina tabacum]|uniref:uncharacterized protein LOC142548180 n=1 Tax=Primulina tabacum TaxID=48773 RepID=UPI003F5A3B88
MIIALRAKNKIVFIDGSHPRPAVGHASLHPWERCNALVLSWLMNTVSKEIYGGIVCSTDASTVWSDLKEQFDKVNGSRNFSIHRDINRLTQGSSAISAYYSKLKHLWDEYASLVTLPSCECDTARRNLNHDQQQKLLQFLIGLNDSYMTIRSQILMMSPLPSVGQDFSIISQEESHRSLILVDSKPASVFYSMQHRAENREKNQPYCEYCNWTGHTKATCYKLVGYPLGHRLYWQQPRGDNRRNPRIYVKPKMPVLAANLVEDNNHKESAADCVSHVPVSSQEQYAEIMKLLGGHNTYSSNTPAANMAGPDEWENSWDW